MLIDRVLSKSVNARVEEMSFEQLCEVIFTCLSQQLSTADANYTSLRLICIFGRLVTMQSVTRLLDYQSILRI